MKYVVRLGVFYLQVPNGWGELSCADRLTEKEAKAYLKWFDRGVVEPAPEEKR